MLIGRILTSKAVALYVALINITSGKALGTPNVPERILRRGLLANSTAVAGLDIETVKHLVAQQGTRRALLAKPVPVQGMIIPPIKELVLRT